MESSGQIVISLEELEEARQDPRVQRTLRRADESNRRMHVATILEVLTEELIGYSSHSTLEEIAQKIYERNRKGPWLMPDMSNWEDED